jgi:CheY-like chemotaxis protein
MSITNNLFPNSKLLKDVKILVVENDRDSRNLYALVLEGYGTQVTTFGSIEDSLDLLDWYIPNLLICEMRFLGESVYPLIQRVRSLALSCGKMIPILATSTCSLTVLAQLFQVEVEAYWLKPIDLDHFVSKVWNLICLSSIVCLPKVQDCVIKQVIGKTLCSAVMN